MFGDDPDNIELPKVVPVADQPCQQLYEGNPVLLGFDVVQYHFIPSVKNGGVAVRGKPDFAYNFEGYQFWFSTLENRQRFIDDPWKYAPAWGGFCSWGVGLEVEGWPWAVDFLGPPASPWNGWLIVDGVLIFNIWESYSDRFARNLDTNMALAAKRWSQWFGQGKHRFAGPFNTHCIGHGRLKNWCLSKQPSPWLENLPECTVEQVEISEDGDGMDTSAGLNTSSASVVVSGGGIVSDANEFSDFSNARFRYVYAFCSIYSSYFWSTNCSALPVLWMLMPYMYLPSMQSSPTEDFQSWCLRHCHIFGIAGPGVLLQKEVNDVLL